MGLESLEEFTEKHFVSLDVVDDVNLIEEDEGVEDIVRRVVQRPCHDDVLEELEAIGLHYLLFHPLFSERDDLLVLRGVLEVLSIRGFESWIFRVV